MKSKILAIFFFSIVAVQVGTLIYMANTSFMEKHHVPKVALLGPFVIALAGIAELYAFRFFRRRSETGDKLANSFIYGFTAIEVSFPSIIFVFILVLIGSFNSITTNQVLTSPPFVMYFIMIALSSLLMNVKLSVFAGFLAATEYMTISVFLLRANSIEGLDVPNTIIRALLLAVFGIIIGFVSRKILESVISALDSKNKLINELDGMVKEKTKEIMEQKEELAIKNKDITDSINYAKRIQTGILPQAELMNASLKDYFIFYRPKDIVSGDFYWASLADRAPTSVSTLAEASETNDKKEVLYIAACDCTGHGVPGGFMSMLGNTLLNHAVRKKNVQSPAELLNSVNEELPKNLRSHDMETSIRDGMDIALCSIDPKNKKLVFAGANNPCWIVRTSGTSIRSGSSASAEQAGISADKSVLIEIKPNKQPISASNEIEKKDFTNNEFDLEHGDIIYLFTDGFADQFGGPKGKKFKYKQLQEKLLSISGKSTAEQRNILEACFDEWRTWPDESGNKRDIEQIDDVLIIGIRV